ncbi:unnamed protein product [Lactuca virosa]|uniref:Uncharacterized protein n=1 Tax=Lactuca virosa TaxID=75947 RepID=A0AAU9MML9_9ASTR|nr:unnamed protein product [Lactuca virosa]
MIELGISIDGGKHILSFATQAYGGSVHNDLLVEWYGLANSIQELTSMTFEANDPYIHFNVYEMFRDGFWVSIPQGRVKMHLFKGIMGMVYMSLSPMVMLHLYT